MDSMKAVLIAFIFMSIVVFFIFKKYVPSMAVIICAFSDIIVTIATINLLNIKLSTAGVAALLMLIGYSVDTDILLSTRLIKEKKGTIFERIKSALRTGLTMNATTFITVLIGLIVSQSPELKQIFTILLIGLIIDIINTWIQNMSLLRLYLEKPKLSKKITYVLGLAFTNLFLLIFFYLFNWNMTIIIIALIVLDLIIILMNLFKTKNKKTTKVEENE
jgi:preprotein translocase subunit SecF